MFGGKSKALRRLIDDETVIAAIEAAEKQTSSEIRVAVARFFWGRVQKAAETCFGRIGMAETKARNGVLFFIVPSRRRFAVVGDVGIHEKAGQVLWDSVAAAVETKFRAGDFSGGLVDGIAMAGQSLAEHFPHDASTDTNELKNEIAFEGE